MANYTLQHDFDYVLDAIVGQGKPSMDGDGCAYIASDGSRCAMGHMLSPNEIQEFDGCTVLTALANGVLPHRFHEYAEFYASMQEAHDEAAFTAKAVERVGGKPAFLPDFIRRMVQIARDWDLTVLSVKEAA